MGILPQDQYEKLNHICELYPLPSSYAVLAMDTTGTDLDEDYVLGVVLSLASIMPDGTFVQRLLRYYAFDWACTEFAEAAQQRASKARTEPWVARNGGLCCDQLWWTYQASLYDTPEGAAERLLADLSDVLTTELTRGIVGHGIFQFSWPMLQAALSRLGKQLPDSESVNLVDTGLIEKAIQMDMTYPWTSESRASWLNRMAERPDKVKWSLATHCQAKYALSADPPQTVAGSGASRTVLLTHQLLRRYRALLGSGNENWEIGTDAGQG